MIHDSPFQSKVYWNTRVLSSSTADYKVNQISIQRTSQAPQEFLKNVTLTFQLFKHSKTKWPKPEEAFSAKTRGLKMKYRAH